MSQTTWIVRRVEPRDREVWQSLFAGYCEFYKCETSAEQIDSVWSWIQEEHLVDAFFVEPANGGGRPVGIAHLRSWVSSLRGEKAGYLDDLYVDPEHRGTGAAESLFDAIRELAVERGWSVVHWTTADDNYRARGLYDQVAKRTGWLTYEMTVKKP